MLIFKHEVMSFETDMYGNLRPSQLLRYAMHASGERLYTDNLDKAIEKSGLPTGWMLARIKNEQFAPLHAGDMLEIHCSQRAVQGASYVRQVHILRDGETVSDCLMMWMLIDMDKRRIMRVSELEKFEELLPPTVELPEVKRLAQRKDMPEIAQFTVPRSLCDMNGHFSSANYLDLICDAFGFWEDGAKLMRSVQIDFHSEFLPGESVCLSGLTENGETQVRGAHVSGASGFTACVVME